MKANGSQTYTLQKVKDLLNSALNKEDAQVQLYNSVDGALRIVEGILKTNGTNWASHVYDDEGKQMLTPNEQVDFDRVLKPYIDDIIHVFRGEIPKQQGGQNIITNTMPVRKEQLTPIAPTTDESDIIESPRPKKSNLNRISNNLIRTKLPQQQQQSQGYGIDGAYAKMINKFGTIDNTVKNYASQHGILRLEKEHDLKEDIQLIPEPAIAGISSALMAATEGVIPATVTQEVLHKMKVPFRTIVVASYLALDMARLTFGLKDYTLSRRIMSILLSLIDLLRGDWKKAVLSFVGYFGKAPLVYGEIGKVFVTLYETIDPQIRESMTYGLLDLSKSMMVGTLLTIFQAIAPDFVRLKAIEALETIASMKAKIDGDLEGAGKSARPDYYAPQYEDFANIQAVMSDNAMICSEEFQNAIQALSMSTILRLVLDILRIPSNKDMVKARCGTTLKSYDELLAQEADKRNDIDALVEGREGRDLEEEQQQEQQLDDPVKQDSSIISSLTAPITDTASQIQEQATKFGEQATKAKQLIPTSMGNARNKSLKLARKGLQSLIQ